MTNIEEIDPTPDLSIKTKKSKDEPIWRQYDDFNSSR
jgi:hypothetical protein